MVKWIGRCDYKCFSIFLHLQKRKQTKSWFSLKASFFLLCSLSCFKGLRMYWGGRLLFPGMETLISHCFPGERWHPKQVYLVLLTFDCHHLKHLSRVPQKCSYEVCLFRLFGGPHYKTKPSGSTSISLCVAETLGEKECFLESDSGKLPWNFALFRTCWQAVTRPTAKCPEPLHHAGFSLLCSALIHFVLRENCPIVCVSVLNFAEASKIET